LLFTFCCFFPFTIFFLYFRIFFHIFLQCFLFMYFPCFCTVERFFFFRQFLGKKSGLSQCTQVLYYCTTKMTHKLQFSWKLSMHYKKKLNIPEKLREKKINFYLYFTATRQSDGLQMEDTNSRKKSRQEVGRCLTS